MCDEFLAGSPFIANRKYRVIRSVPNGTKVPRPFRIEYLDPKKRQRVGVLTASRGKVVTITLHLRLPLSSVKICHKP